MLHNYLYIQIQGRKTPDQKEITKHDDAVGQELVRSEIVGQHLQQNSTLVDMMCMHTCGLHVPSL